ncbi:succinate dehydrogenase (ubiquinone) membrane anchor subunit [Geosmithia morbida]|uniref:Succinate dehydrogenase [ubiquinone] cytochrome b small subunit n=1 Tax=Geosmithia morbida TaxID=1094350 RepID=A0A9P5D3J8_9HYPO|nr:succinate dehydrogenase (ubiquinone) membrane anchor subunit [Geosmithia morbida]KAF4125027.1 succinate dehydrogenase (ubiquinone) membrane anchor subunit [Geosmithia morbida]
MASSIVRPATLLRSSAGVSRSAFATAFHTSARRSAIIPPGPLNDPAPVPPPDATHGSYHWAFERLLAAGLVPLSVAPFAAGSLNPTLDALLCGTVLIHSHMGFQSVIIDYFPKAQVPNLRKFLWWSLNAATLLVGVSLYEFETNDVGVTETIKRIWKA